MPTGRNQKGGAGRNRTWRTRLLALPLVIAACVIAALLPSAAGAATAAPATIHSVAAKPVVPAASDPCKGKSETYIVKKFFRGPAVYPLRCGTSSWGYIHLVKGHPYDPSAIALTVARGQQDAIFQIFTYVLSRSTCPTVTYKVVYNDGALHGTKVRPQGIITAYAVVTEAVPGVTGSSPKSPNCG
jgi:hypothetical protein